MLELVCVKWAWVTLKLFHTNVWCIERLLNVRWQQTYHVSFNCLRCSEYLHITKDNGFSLVSQKSPLARYICRLLTILVRLSKARFTARGSGCWRAFCIKSWTRPSFKDWEREDRWRQGWESMLTKRSETGIQILRYIEMTAVPPFGDPCT